MLRSYYHPSPSEAPGPPTAACSCHLVETLRTGSGASPSRRAWRGLAALGVLQSPSFPSACRDPRVLGTQSTP